ncbi:TetR/AcrR family transcriptional regulator [Comamonas aquatica]|uniref:TetR/AcrR family transcriptional regulator n=1 Tax=Comamonas aquatica TaxID=225991 RepID=UPI001B36824D|nr:TetR/AcrR family transcriptional regulator [Comamonas aquatica]QTX22167.1 TetR/AcrR family transcriptional regulator [Comamonas aquatica]
MTDHPSSSAHSARGRSRRKEARPAELLEAATRLFVEKGYAATKVEEVAALAQVSKGTLFLYYPSKQALLKAVVRENIAGRFAEWQAELEAFAGTTPELVRYAFQVWQERIGDTYAGGICKLMASECCNFPELASFYLEEVVEPGNALVRRILERGVARGELRPLDLDAAIHLITTPMFAYIHWRHSIGMLYPQSLGVSAPLYFQTHVDNLLRGLSATAPDV